jgi:hypothetical protein
VARGASPRSTPHSNTLHRLDTRLLTVVNGFARHTGWLHGAVVGNATYGVVVFAALLLAGLWLRRAAADRALARAGWAPPPVLLAVGLHQPLVSAFAGARSYTTHPGLLVLAHRSADFSFPSDHPVMAGAAGTGWLRARPGLPQAFPVPGTLPAAREPSAVETFAA